MIEVLGPNMARSLVGDAYTPNCRYELETTEDGFHLIITDKESGESHAMYLEPEMPSAEKMPPIWEKRDQSLLPRDIGSRLWFWLLILGTIAIIVLCVLGK